MTSPPDAPGFAQITCDRCAAPDLWLQCNGCKRRATFLLHDDGFSCICGARYATATCSCGASIPPAQLRPVPFEKGPVSFADLEVDWPRVALLGAVAAALMGSGLWLWLG